MRTMWVVDGQNQAFRQYFGAQGPDRRLSAISGLFHTLQEIVYKRRPRYLVVALDHPAPTWRAKLYAGYKGTRQERPAELEDQVPWLERVCECLGVVVLSVKGFEADDIIASVTKKAVRGGVKVRILSSDKDLRQLVSDQVSTQDSYQAAPQDYQDVFERFGVLPHQMREYLALVGDSGDAVPGVRGIGPARAAKMLKDKTLKQIVDDETDTSRERKLLLGSLEACRLAYRLIGLRSDVPVPALPELACNPRSYENASKRFDRLVTEYMAVAG